MLLIMIRVPPTDATSDALKPSSSVLSADHDNPEASSSTSNNADHKQSSIHLDPNGPVALVSEICSTDPSTQGDNAEEENVKTDETHCYVKASSQSIEKKTVKIKPTKVSRSKSNMTPSSKDNSTMIQSWFKRKLSPEKDMDTSNTVKFPRGDNGSK